jgi:glutaconate CoA-transferase subunit B
MERVAMTLTADQRAALHAARVLNDGELCFVGIGIPSLAAMAAKRLHAPRLALVYESGAVDADPLVPPLSTGSPSVATRTAMLAPMLSAFAALQQGRIDWGLLSAAQVDAAGQLNSTVLGSYGRPRLRLPGSGGAHDIAALARRLLILMPHEPRRFVPRVDFATCPPRPDALLVTDRAMFDFAGPGGTMRLVAVADDVSPDHATEGFGFTPDRAHLLRALPAPTGAELAALGALRQAA